MKNQLIFIHVAVLCIATLLLTQGTRADTAGSGSAAPAPLMEYLAAELAYSMEHLAAEDGTKPYYLAYAVYEEQRAYVSASLGATMQDLVRKERTLNIDLRVGDYTLDNTHQLRGGGPSRAYGSGGIPVALENDEDSIRQTLWYYTDQEFKQAVERLAQIKTNLKVKVEEEDKSDDFSREKSHVYHEAPTTLMFDRPAWTERLRRITAIARDYPLIHDSSIGAGALAGTRYMVSSEGTRLQTAERRYRITISAATTAEDGMQLSQSFDFNAATVDRLPGDAELEAAFRQVIGQVLALRGAPLAEPYIGPAILRNRASGVFFHEIFGHRIEGHRQKDVTEGQTFTKKLGQPVLPDFLSVIDDPTRARLGDVDLRGHYLFDDEGVRAQKAILVENGVLKSFLMSRSPVEGFPHSNGHGRRQAGNTAVARQANLIVESTKTVPFEELRRLLIEECKRRNRPYGLLFEDISGGFTTTSRYGPQSFKVLPIVVYRVYVDGRPDELIRGADIVGTPLTCFEKILCTADDPGVFNGTCGAESGWVPVSAVYPSILVGAMETEKRQRAQNRPPILQPPLGINPETSKR